MCVDLLDHQDGLETTEIRDHLALLDALDLLENLEYLVNKVAPVILDLSERPAHSDHVVNLEPRALLETPVQWAVPVQPVRLVTLDHLDLRDHKDLKVPMVTVDWMEKRVTQVQMDSTASEDYLDNPVVMAKMVHEDDEEKRADPVTEVATATKDHVANLVHLEAPAPGDHQDLEDLRDHEVIPARAVVMEQTVVLENGEMMDYKDLLDVQDSLDVTVLLAFVEQQEHQADLVKRDPRASVDLREQTEFKDLVDAQDLRAQ